MSIITVDNFNSSFCNNSEIINKLGFELTINKNKNYIFTSTALVKDTYITIAKYKQNQNQNILFSLIGETNQKDDDLIISISSYINKENTNNYDIQTGNYIGKFKYNKDDIDIKSRFSDLFLKRMLNFANDVYLDDVSVFDAQNNEKNSLDYSKFIIYYMFIQQLEKAFLLGLPKSYVSVNHHEMKVKGKININRFIKYDIPFKGKISSTSREQKEIQEIIDVLYKSITIIEKESKNNNGISIKNILHIKTHLKQHKSNRYVSNETVNKAIKSKALQNPIFSPYKKVLEYAKLIIDANNLEEKKDADKETFGFLVNVAELFEIYLVKLLQHRMPDWNIQHDRDNKISLYKEQFYSRHMYPDIVMKHKYNNKVMVFDAKYKRMTFKTGGGDGGYGDLDRSDFYQIHSYMSYYNNQENTTLIAGGLLYPISSEFDCRFSNDEKCNKEYTDKKAHSDSWFGSSKTKFIVDGIDLSKDNLSMDDILESENSFIERIQKISENRE